LRRKNVQNYKFLPFLNFFFLRRKNKKKTNRGGGEMCFFLLFTSEFERKLTKKIIGGLNKANDVSQHLSPNTHTKGK
jgi:hypothetical protein